MERSGHFAASTQPLQDDGVQAHARRLGRPAWTVFLAGLCAGLLGTAAVLLRERDNLQAGARMQDSQVARRSVAQVERQFETSGLLLRAVQSSFMVSDDIDQQQFADVHDNLHAQEVLPSLVAMVFARRSEPERPGGPPGDRKSTRLTSSH